MKRIKPFASFSIIVALLQSTGLWCQNLEKQRFASRDQEQFTGNY